MSCAFSPWLNQDSHFPSQRRETLSANNLPHQVIICFYLSIYIRIMQVKFRNCMKKGSIILLAVQLAFFRDDLTNFSTVSSGRFPMFL